MFVPLLGIKPLLSSVTTSINSNVEQCTKTVLLTTGPQLYLLYHLASFLLHAVTCVNMLTVLLFFSCGLFKALIII